MSPRRWLLLVAILALAALMPLGLKNYGIYLMTLLCVYTITTMGLNLTVGYAGQNTGFQHTKKFTIPRPERFHLRVAWQ